MTEDAGLSVLGRRQVRLAAERLRERATGSMQCISGPLRRQTESMAELRDVLGLRETVQVEPRFAEFEMEMLRVSVRAAWGGDLPPWFVAFRAGELVADPKQMTELFRAIDLWVRGEVSGDFVAFDTFLERVSSGLRAHSASGDVLVATSGGVIAAALAHGCQDPGGRFLEVLGGCAYGSITELHVVDGGFGVVDLCDTSFLPTDLLRLV